MVEHYISKVRQIPTPKPDRLESFFEFAIAVQNLCITIEQTGHLNHLANPILLKELVEKLPTMVKINWAKYKYRASDDEDMIMLCNFLRTLTEDLRSVGINLNTIQHKRSNNRESIHIHDESTRWKCIV